MNFLRQFYNSHRKTIIFFQKKSLRRFSKFKSVSYKDVCFFCSQVCQLLKRGAIQEMSTVAGETPLDLAIASPNADIVTLLRLAKLNEEIKESDLANHGIILFGYKHMHKVYGSKEGLITLKVLGRGKKICHFLIFV